MMIAAVSISVPVPPMPCRAVLCSRVSRIKIATSAAIQALGWRVGGVRDIVTM